jgi:diguanylate cyclase (GGDEF)-like protein
MSREGRAPATAHLGRERILIAEDLAQRLKSSESLPCPPGVATRIIELANDPDVDIARIAQALSIDPAMTASVLRIANSPIYAMPREVANLGQALMLLGLNATISLALSFSLLKSWQNDAASNRLDDALFWKRALLAASATRAIAARLGWRDSEEMFLAALIQDIGVLALDRALPDLYEGLGDDQIRQSVLIEREREHTGGDHADVGAWLLERWAFPERILTAVRASHDPESAPVEGRDVLFVRAVAFSSSIAELFLEKDGARRFSDIARDANSWLGLDAEGVGELIADVANMIPDTEVIFETRLLGKSEAEAVLNDAREVFMRRNAPGRPRTDGIEKGTESPRKKTGSLAQAAQRDLLTGLYNRAYLDPYLETQFQRAAETGTPLSIAFADLDRFKLINDAHGQPAGDQVLTTVANILKANVRQADVVARYGGEEFILVFPNAGFLLVNSICERIIRAIESTRHDIDGQHLPITISMGLATHNDRRHFSCASELVRAADKALYSAKLQGRNRSIAFESIADTQFAAI